MTELAYRQLLEFVALHPYDDAADVGGDPSLDFGSMSFLPTRTLYDLKNGHDICVRPLPRQHKTIICMDLFEHINDPVRAAEHLVASLAPGGWLFLTTLFVFHKHDYPVDMYRYTDTALSWLFRALEAEKCWMEFERETPITPGSRVSIIARQPA